MPSTFAAEDPVMTSLFFDTSQKFDAALKTKKEHGGIERLVGQYLVYLQNLEATIKEDSPYLKETTLREIQRLDSIKSEYLTHPEKFARIRLDHDWANSISYHHAATDFRTVLDGGLKESQYSQSRRPDFEPDFSQGIQLFGKPYLCPLKSFVESFADVSGLKETGTGSRTLIGMPGFPKNSFYYHSYDGHFKPLEYHDAPFNRLRYVQFHDSQFNRMYVVTDGWDQVVAVQFTSEHPNSGYYRVESNGIQVFNFVQFRRKATTDACVSFQSYQDYSNSQHVRHGVLLQTCFVDSVALKEINLLYLPEPTLRLIRYSLSLFGEAPHTSEHQSVRKPAY